MKADRSEGKLRRHALAIFKAALRAANPEQAVAVRLAREDFSRYRHIYIVGAGKAGAAMARAAERVLGRRVTAGLLNVKYGHVAPLRRVGLNECGHPVPDERGVEGARRIAALVAGAGSDDLVLCLISGGASALLPLPADPVTLHEKQEVTKLLLACGAGIHEINAVRKHISQIKGGQLARLAYPARVLSLLLSDVIGDDLDVIGSGPTAPDGSTFADARAVLEKYGILAQAPASIRDRLQRGSRGEIAETPKRGDRLFARVRNVVIGSNRLAVDAAAARARALGLHTLVLSTFVEGETREVARMHAAIAKEIVHAGRPLKPPACVITGGETTVTLRGDGLGGRNQEFVLSAAIDIAGLPNVVVLSAGTDGSDGPTDAAGAIADGRTATRKPGAAEFLARNDSYRYFESLGDLIVTGPTNTNVMDVHLILVGGHR
ncbi:MAG: glycerate kinase [Bryobacteraceae bacterium]|jgi:hydroxypyruvate reductase